MENMHEPVMMDAPEFIRERMSHKLFISLHLIKYWVYVTQECILRDMMHRRRVII